MKIVMIHGQNHKGSTYHVGRILAEKLSGEITESTNKDMADSLFFWGISKIYRIGIAVQATAYEQVTGKIKNKIEHKTTIVAEQIIKDHGKTKPGIRIRGLFFIMHLAQKKGILESDSAYWKEKGWTGKKRPWKSGTAKNTLENPWKEVNLIDYEAHMTLPDVYQIQTLSKIMKSQMEDYPAKTLAIWGVAGGNGLEHLSGRQYRKVFGIDINEHYLQKCGSRYPELQDILELCHVDLMEEDCHLPPADEIIINLLVEYIGIECLVKQVQRVEPKYISCVIQQNQDKSFVSYSPYQEAFEKVSALHQNIDREKLVSSMCEAGYRNILVNEYPLPNGKVFVRLDFMPKIKQK